MAIYIFNLLVGYRPCGVDNAQAYRAKMLDHFSASVRYVFTELPGMREIDYYSGLGIPTDEMLCAHRYFTDNHSLKQSGKVKAKLEELKECLHYTEARQEGNGIRILKNGEVIADIVLAGERKDCFERILYFKQGKIVSAEVYTSGLSYAEYYVTAVADNETHAKLTRRTFFNIDGSVAYEQIFSESGAHYLFPNGACITKSEFIGEFVKRLGLTENDIVLLDRFSQFDFIQPLFRFGNRAQFIAVIHSGHYFEKNENPYRLYLNEDYFYLLKYTQFVDTIVVSTQEQKEELAEKLREYEKEVPRIEVIPAGGLDRLRYPEAERRPYSLLAVSRLDKLKRIHWIFKAVIKAHQKNPEICLDVYGSGNMSYVSELQRMVEENKAQQYIRFMGYMDVTEIYRNYEVLLSASLLETLGLSVLEAVGSGTAVIALNVKYGNRLLVHSGENGYLIDIDPPNAKEDGQQIDDMAEKIVEIFRDRKQLEKFHLQSYAIAKDFLLSKVEEKWKTLLER